MVLAALKVDQNHCTALHCQPTEHEHTAGPLFPVQCSESYVFALLHCVGRLKYVSSEPCYRPLLLPPPMLGMLGSCSRSRICGVTKPRVKLLDQQGACRPFHGTGSLRTAGWLTCGCQEAAQQGRGCLPEPAPGYLLCSTPSKPTIVCFSGD